MALAAMRDLGGAANLLSRHLERTSRPAVLLVAWGRVLEAAGRVPEAVAQIQQAMDLEPANVWAVSEATRLAEQHGNLRVAAEGYARLCQLLPGDLEPAMARARLLARLGDRGALAGALEEALQRAHAQSRLDVVGELEAAMRAAGTAQAGRRDAAEVGACAA